MRRLAFILSAFLCASFLLMQAEAQPPGKDKKDYSNSTIVTAIMAFDKDKTGSVKKEQVADTRLHRLFDLADTNKEGVVTREQLVELATKLETEFAQGGGGGGGGPGKGGKGGFGKDGKGGKGGPPQPGQILPPFVQEMLNLTSDQKKQLNDLQKEVDGKLSKILTEEQQNQLKEMRKGKGGPGKDGPPPPPPPGDDAPPPPPKKKKDAKDAPVSLASPAAREVCKAKREAKVTPAQNGARSDRESPFA